MNLPIEIIVGRGGTYDPVAGATDCNIPTIKGSAMWVEKTGYGAYKYSLYSKLSTGGFRLLGGTTFEQGESWYVHASNILAFDGDSDYTNGFNYSQVMNALMGRLGWRNSPGTGQPVLNSSNLLSKSHRYFNDGHALVSIPNIKAMLGNDISDNDLNSELQSIQTGVIMRALNAVFSEREYIDQTLMFTRYGKNDQPIPNTGSFAGVQIKVAPMFDKSVQIDSAVLYFTEDVTFTLYLFQDGKKTPIWNQEVSAVGYEATVVDLTDLILNYINPAGKGVKFWLGYFQDDLGTAKAIQETVESYPKTYIFSAVPFYSDKISGETNFNRENTYLTSQPMGINIQVSSFNDWTQLIVKKANLFDEMQSLVMNYSVIERIVYSVRQNGNQLILKDAITMASAISDLTGSAPVSEGPPPVTGLNKRIEREASRLKKSFFPKEKPQSVSLC